MAWSSSMPRARRSAWKKSRSNLSRTTPLPVCISTIRTWLKSPRASSRRRVASWKSPTSTASTWNAASCRSRSWAAATHGWTPALTIPCSKPAASLPRLSTVRALKWPALKRSPSVRTGSMQSSWSAWPHRCSKTVTANTSSVCCLRRFFEGPVVKNQADLETRVSSTKNFFVHSHALCESENIGKDTRVWAFAHILPGATLGSECNVCDNVFIENDVIIGDRVTLKCGVQVWDGITIEDDVFIGPNATFTNDLFPRSKVYPQTFARTIVRKGASLGANCTILPGLTIGTNAMIGAGAVVTRSIPPNAIVVGNPAKIIGYVDAKPVDATQDGAEKVAGTPGAAATSVNGVTLHTMTEVADIRGSLSAGEFERTVPFKSERYFLVYDVPTAETRGEH